MRLGVSVKNASLNFNFLTQISKNTIYVINSRNRHEVIFGIISW